MKQFEISKVFKIFEFDFKNHRGTIIAWFLGIFATNFLYMILFPSIHDMAAIELNMMPESIMKLFGMDKSMLVLDNYVSYFGMIYKILMVAICIFASSFTSNLIYNEEKTKSIEFLNSIHINRAEIYFSKALTSLVAIVIVIIGALISTLICGVINGGATFIVADIFKIILFSSFTAFFFWALALLIAGFTAKTNPSSLTLSAVLISYVIGYLSLLLRDIKWLKYFSPFEIFSPESIINLTADTIAALSIYSVVLLLFVALGVIKYKNRDLAI